MVLTTFSKKGKSTEGKEKGMKNEFVLQKQMGDLDSETKTLTVLIQLWKRSTKKKIDKKKKKDFFRLV
jgi:hypothetical protein